MQWSVFAGRAEKTKIQLTTGNSSFPVSIKSAHRLEGVIPSPPMGGREFTSRQVASPAEANAAGAAAYKAVCDRLVHLSPRTPVKPLPHALERDFAELVSLTGSWHSRKG